jgi:hypothetical protein
LFETYAETISAASAATLAGSEVSFTEAISLRKVVRRMIRASLQAR